MRPIDADALLKAFADFPYGYRGMIKLEIENTPTIDAVPVIRCKDCKHMSNETDQRDGSDVFICNFNRWRRMEGKRRDDFYCADGERKDNDRP